jgi:PhzF family phenazine biosynthesis protein
MTQGKIEYLPSPSSEEREHILHALGLIEEDLDERCPIQILSTGNPKVMIGIKSRDKLNNLSPDMLALVQISKVINCTGYFVFTLDARQKDVLTHGRMFAPAIGINEDPVTGNANGPLGAYLIKNGIVHDNGPNFSFTGEQGYALGRSGLVDVSVSLKMENLRKSK